MAQSFCAVDLFCTTGGIHRLGLSGSRRLCSHTAVHVAAESIRRPATWACKASVCIWECACRQRGHAAHVWLPCSLVCQPMWGNYVVSEDAPCLCAGALSGSGSAFASDMAVTAACLSALAAQCFLFFRLYRSDPGWARIGCLPEGLAGQQCEYCSAVPPERSRHDFNTGAGVLPCSEQQIPCRSHWELAKGHCLHLHSRPEVASQPDTNFCVE